MRSRSVLILLFEAVLLLHPESPTVHADETPLPVVTRQVTGTVKDSSGRHVPGAQLRLETVTGQIIGRTDSDAAGHFAFRGVQPGTYTVVASKADFEVSTTDAVVTEEADAGVVLTMEAAGAEDIVVTAKRLDVARNEVFTKTGGSVYHFSEETVNELPRGQDTPLNDVILQAPSVAQDSFGQLHIRGDHANIQYRFNGIPLPEGISPFAQVLTPRFANKIDVLTGALPAEYGFRTAGIIDITTKSGFSDVGTDLDLFGGQRGTFTPTLETGGSVGKFSYYGVGQYDRADRFIEPPTPGPSATNGWTNQGRGFTYLSYLLGPETRLSFLSGTSVVDFGLPEGPGVMPAFTLSGVPTFDSRNVKDWQREENYYNVIALQGTVDRFDYQLAGIDRYSRVAFYPDSRGDLIFNGIAANVVRSSFTNGFQLDTGYRLTDTDTIRTGGQFSGNGVAIQNRALVFPADSMGMQTRNVPFRVVDNTSVTEFFYGGYLQNEWRPLDGLIVNVGARLDRYRGFTEGSQLSPRAGLSYQLTPATVVHAAYSRYFTPPPAELVTATDARLFQHTTGAVASPGNTKVSPDRSHYFDVGATQRLLGFLNLGIDSYYRIDRHILDEGQFGNALVFTPFNYKKGQIFGVEGTASATVGPASGYLNLAYSEALGKEVVSEQFLFAPDELAFIKGHYIHLDHDQTYTASAGVSYRFHGFLFSDTIIAGSGLRSGFVNMDHLPYYIQDDLGAEKPVTVPHFGDVTLRASVINVADNTYLIRSGGSGIGVGPTQYGPRRTFYFGINIPLPFGRGPKPSTS